MMLTLLGGFGSGVSMDALNELQFVQMSGSKN